MTHKNRTNEEVIGEESNKNESIYWTRLLEHGSRRQMAEKEMSKKPRKCPFCNSHDVQIDQSGSEVKVHYWIRCNKCGGLGAWHESKSAAVKMWNTRGGRKP